MKNKLSGRPRHHQHPRRPCLENHQQHRDGRQAAAARLLALQPLRHAIRRHPVRDVVGIAIALEIPFGPVIPTVAIVVSVWLLIQADLHKILIGLGGLVIAVPFYFLMKEQYLEGK
ncbi:hypothetical protein [uncultured Selenomonas sp.]|uniref:hypothetical protein n=1 Tax=uncultured Selenomonas sp. TaxID=159275 RepID=UPI002600B290|nr:hypothetical protein [uncultured Selenomonas sp.]